MQADLCRTHYATRTELRDCCAQSDAWLAPAEHEELARWRSPRRREEWIAGRIVLKRLILAHLRQPSVRACDIAIGSTGADGRSVRPCVRVAGQIQDWSVSLSHTERGILAAICFEADVTVAVDLTPLQAFSEGFLRMWFTPREREWLETADAEQIAAAWSIKETLYKALNDGEPFTPRHFEVLPGASGFSFWHGGEDVSDRVEMEIEEMDGQVAVTAIVRAAVLQECAGGEEFVA